MKLFNSKDGGEPLEIKPSKFFWAWWVLAVCLLALGVCLLPVWKNVNVFWRKWASEGISLMLFVILAIYIIYLCCGFRKNAPKAKNILRALEVTALVAVAVICLLQQFDLFHIIGPCFVVGAILWLRGVVCTLNAYMFNVKKKDRTLKAVLLGLAAVTGGTVLMVRRFTAPVFIWVISVGLLLFATIAVFLGIVSKPKKENADADE